ICSVLNRKLLYACSGQPVRNTIPINIEHRAMSNREFFDPSWENTNVVVVESGVLRQAERWIKSCEACTPDEAQMPFDWVLDKVTGCDPSVTDYVVAEAGIC